MAVCQRCGWWDRICKCSPGAGGVITQEWITKGEWEHIDPRNPHLKFNSREELIEACEKRGLIPKALMKPKSQGKGFEIRRRAI